ncbi:MAG: class I SAM-dependent methyltransferase [Fidelibacterota bacterium]|nr:MAG: class I SAM-dependent methyltransferase [Candidatus Neomarinimicrobiota bacterium]
MRNILRYNYPVSILSLCMSFLISPVLSQEQKENPDLDKKVREVLDSYRWRDMNIPASDGQILYDIIIENNYKKALEIGTSTGHSGIWIAWALSKTGGKLITVEINESRYREALANFREAGLSEYIDARLADAHELVPKLEGPFDFVFSDADKYWYKNYAMAVLPKLEVGGCFTAHNVSRYGRRSGGGIGEFVDYMTSLPNLETTFGGPTGRSSLSISYKKSK